MSTIEKALKKAGNEGQQTNNPLKQDQPSADKDQIITQSDAQQAPLTSDDSISDRQTVAEDVNKYDKVKLDLKKLTTLGFLTSENDNSQQAEEYRGIKRPLVINALSGAGKGIERSNLILVTSSLPAEGKTFTAINLALSIANERDKSVLLIDADVAKPSIAKMLDIRKSPGLIEYLEGSEYGFSDIIVETDIAGLRIVPAGKRHGFSTELLASNKMFLLAEELSKRYPDRIVIFDSPPLLAATQAEVLANLVGQIVLVIESETTLQRTVQESIRKLESCEVVMALLNKAKKDFDLNYYGYGGYGGYGAYGGYGSYGK